MKYCSQCGCEITVESQFCNQCGARLGHAKEAVYPHLSNEVVGDSELEKGQYNASYVYNPEAYQGMNKKTRVKYVLFYTLGIVLSLVIIGILIAVGVYFGSF